MNTEEMTLSEKAQSRVCMSRRRGARRAAERTGEAGFTLLEIVIALLVMMIAVLATVSLFIFAVNYNSGSRDRTVALAIAQQRIERLRNISFTDAALDPTPATGTTTTLFSNGRFYSVTTIVTNIDGSFPNPVNDPRRKTITVRVLPLGGRSVTRDNQTTNEWSFNPVTLSTTRSALKVGEFAQ